MPGSLFESQCWVPALEKFADVTGMSVALFGPQGELRQGPVGSSAFVKLFLQYGFEPGLSVECARRCLQQTGARPAIAVGGAHGLTVVGTSLMLEGRIVGAAIAGYALSGFAQVASVQRWAASAALPFDPLWDIVRRQAPVPDRRLLLHGELLQVLGDALLRENHRTRQYEEMAAKLEASAAARDEFLAVVSHELRTPLAPILGWAGILKKDQSPGQVRQAAEAIERNALLQTRMVDDLLDMNLSSRGAVKLEITVQDLAARMRAALETNAQDAERKGIRVEFTDAGEPLFVNADSGRLQQIFSNIISNAVKFTPAGGTIRMTVTREPGGVKAVVADTGTGITPAFLPFVFEMFRQQDSGARRDYQGLGIGLALVKKLTELQNGSVSVTSAGSGRGTEVTVRFPLAAAPQSPEAPTSPAKTFAASLAGLAVLVIDDNEDAREVLQVLLQHLGAKVSVAGNGREGLDRVQDASPDLVLCDLGMPVMDGYEFVRELRRTVARSRPPVVAVTALASDADRQCTREAGFAAHISKPFDQAALLATVDAVRPHGPHARHSVEAAAGSRV